MTEDNTSQWMDLWGSVQYEDRPENHVKREIGGVEKLIHNMVVRSSATGKDIYVSFFDDSFPGFEHPGKGVPIFVHGKIKPNGDYINMTASTYLVLPGLIKAKRREL